MQLSFLKPPLCIGHQERLWFVAFEPYPGTAAPAAARVLGAILQPFRDNNLLATLPLEICLPGGGPWEPQACLAPKHAPHLGATVLPCATVRDSILLAKLSGSI